MFDTQLYIPPKPAIIIPSEFRLKHWDLINPDDQNRYLDEHKSRGKKGYQLKIFSKQQIANWKSTTQFFPYKRFEFDNKEDWFELFIEMLDPDINWRKYDIDPDIVPYLAVTFTQALTTNPGVLQNFTSDATWSASNTVSLIGGGGAGATSGATNINDAGGGGGGYCAGHSVLGRGNSSNYVVGATNGGSSSWGDGVLSFVALGGTTGVNGAPGSGGSFSGNVFIGAPGGPGGSTSGTGNVARGGCGGGGAGGPSGGGSSGGAPTPTPATGGVGGNSVTATGGTGGGTSPSTNGGTGGTGTDFDGSHGAGAGGGGGGATGPSSSANGGTGGLYGGAGGGAGSTTTPNAGLAGTGQQGMLWLSWSPYAYSEFYMGGG